MAITELTKKLTKSLEQLLNGDEWITSTETRIKGCEGIPDIIAVRRRQYLRKEIRAYEVKASRADFLHDVGHMKWKKYLSVCHRVYFAAPAGMLKKSDIPEGAGLIVLGERGWSVVKTAKSYEPTNLDADAVLSILFARHSDTTKQRDLRERLTAKSNITIQGVADRIGGEIGRRVRGCTPETEKDAARIMGIVDQYFGSKVEAVKALRFAATLINEREAVESMSLFLNEMASGLSPEVTKMRSNRFKVSKRKVKKEKKVVVDLSEMADVISKTIIKKENDRLKERYSINISDLLEVDKHEVN